MKNPHTLSYLSTFLIVAQIALMGVMFGSGEQAALRYAGYLTWVAGIGFAFAPFWILSKHGAPPPGESYMHTTILVKHGLYAYLRHPQFLGWMLISMAVTLVTQHWLVTLLGVSAVAATIMYSYQADRLLIEKFGEDYRRYRTQVPRFNVLRGVWRSR